MENTNVQDTPQAGSQDTSKVFEAPQDNVNQDSSSELSVDDIILGNLNETASAFGTPEQVEQSEVNATEAPVESDNVESDAKNDPQRYQYWHSKSAKLENEVEQLRAQQQQIFQQQAKQNEVVSPEPQQEQKFPDAPTKPSKPRSFSREEAYADSSSESARYLDEVEDWRDNMDEYKEIKHQYDMALIQEKLDAEQKARQNDIQRRDAYMKKQKEVAQVNKLVQTKYGLTGDEAQSFIKEMSSANSLTMDNLVQLWRIRQGQGAPMSGNVQASPSPTFQQTKRAQQVPSPMGVQSSIGQQASSSTEDQIMDRMISDLDSKNPFKLK
jgi:hypothetical protein